MTDKMTTYRPDAVKRLRGPYTLKLLVKFFDSLTSNFQFVLECHAFTVLALDLALKRKRKRK